MSQAFNRLRLSWNSIVNRKKGWPLRGCRNHLPDKSRRSLRFCRPVPVLCHGIHAFQRTQGDAEARAARRQGRTGRLRPNAIGAIHTLQPPKLWLKLWRLSLPLQSPRLKKPEAGRHTGCRPTRPRLRALPLCCRADGASPPCKSCLYTHRQRRWRRAPCRLRTTR